MESGNGGSSSEGDELFPRVTLGLTRKWESAILSHNYFIYRPPVGRKNYKNIIKNKSLCAI